MEHPSQGKTQVFRRGLDESEYQTVLENPRAHTGGWVGGWAGGRAGATSARSGCLVDSCAVGRGGAQGRCGERDEEIRAKAGVAGLEDMSRKGLTLR